MKVYSAVMIFLNVCEWVSKYRNRGVEESCMNMQSTITQMCRQWDKYWPILVWDLWISVLALVYSKSCGLCTCWFMYVCVIRFHRHYSFLLDFTYFKRSLPLWYLASLGSCIIIIVIIIIQWISENPGKGIYRNIIMLLLVGFALKWECTHRKQKDDLLRYVVPCDLVVVPHPFSFQDPDLIQQCCYQWQLEV